MTENCPNCGKKLGIFKTGMLYTSQGKRFCSIKCKEEYTEKNGDVKEWECTCNECKNKWHYLDSAERQLAIMGISNGLLGLGMCCSPCGVIFSNKSSDLSREMGKLKSCPKCGSSNVTRKAKFFNRQ